MKLKFLATNLTLCLFLSGAAAKAQSFTETSKPTNPLKLYSFSTDRLDFSNFYPRLAISNSFTNDLKLLEKPEPRATISYDLGPHVKLNIGRGHRIGPRPPRDGEFIQRDFNAGWLPHSRGRIGWFYLTF